MAIINRENGKQENSLNWRCWMQPERFVRFQIPLTVNIKAATAEQNGDLQGEMLFKRA